jgi:hypothetical protein
VGFSCFGSCDSVIPSRGEWEDAPATSAALSPSLFGFGDFLRCLSLSSPSPFSSFFRFVLDCDVGSRLHIEYWQTKRRSKGENKYKKERRREKVKEPSLVSKRADDAGFLDLSVATASFRLHIRGLSLPWLLRGLAVIVILPLNQFGGLWLRRFLQLKKMGYEEKDEDSVRKEREKKGDLSTNFSLGKVLRGRRG